ncbi:MAG: L-ribulose-5-phosphate 4-epimerase AraD [Gemmatimonadales bacterium]
MSARPDLATLRKEVLEANLAIAERGLAKFTFGNASGIDRASGLVVIKPSGVPYWQLKASDLVVTDLAGTVVEGTLRASSDLMTHLVLYRAFGAIGGVVHTHSHYATVWAQAGQALPCYGTTHADYFHGAIPVTAPLGRTAIATEYESNTGHAIVECLGAQDPLRMPAALVANHASFCWGKSVAAAVEIAAVLEEVAEMAYHTRTLHPDVAPIAPELLDRHFLRKHGPAATYGQPDDAR